MHWERYILYELKISRIIVADVHDSAARAIICEAFKLKMTAKYGYVWFLPHWLSRDWYDVDASRAHTHENIECTSQQMKEVRGFLMRRESETLLKFDYN